jgi:hypothetical protein
MVSAGRGRREGERVRSVSVPGHSWIAASTTSRYTPAMQTTCILLGAMLCLRGTIVFFRRPTRPDRAATGFMSRLPGMLIIMAGVFAGSLGYMFCSLFSW